MNFKNKILLFKNLKLFIYSNQKYNTIFTSICQLNNNNNNKIRFSKVCFSFLLSKKTNLFLIKILLFELINHLQFFHF